MNKYIDTPIERVLVAGATLLTLGIVITFIKGDIPPNLKDLMEWIFIAFTMDNGVKHYTKMRIKGPRKEVNE